MDVERVREFLWTLPHVVETMQFGDNLIFWVADKAIGGKMFTLVDLDPAPGGTLIRGVASFAAGKERAAELLEREGLFPAPYLARIGWVAAERWGALRPREWEEELRAAHALTLAKLPPKTLKLLALPGPELETAVVAGRWRREAQASAGLASKRLRKEPR